MITAEEARGLVRRAVELTPADQAEAVIIAGQQALTRFANNRIHQNVAEEDARLSVRAVLGKRQGVASTNRLDELSLRACCETAVEAARHAVEDPGFPGLPAPLPLDVPDRSREATRAFGPLERAHAAGAIIGQSSEHGLMAAGKVEVSEHAVAIANSLGVDVGQEMTGVEASVLSMGEEGGSGWAAFTSLDASELAPEALGDQASTLARRSSDPTDLEPGSYTVVLAPDAVADLLSYLSFASFSAKAVAEDRSFMSGRLGERLMDERVTIVDDAASPHGHGLVFDFEGIPKRRTALVDAGVAKRPVTDSYWAARTGADDTGHALPAPNPYGPMPLDLEILPGDSSAEEMIAATGRGVYVTRFHYVNIEDPVKALLTGMTRDGTFMIESGRLTRPLKNLRFTQSAVDALARVQAVGRFRQRVADEIGSTLVPALLIEDFGFTGQTR